MRLGAGGKSARASVSTRSPSAPTSNIFIAISVMILPILPLLKIVECHTSTGTEKQTNILFILHAAFGKWYGQEKGMWKWNEGVLERIRAP